MSGLPSPIQALWAEARGRQQASGLDGEVRGLCVALSILTCRDIEDIELDVRRGAT